MFTEKMKAEFRDTFEADRVYVGVSAAHSKALRLMESKRLNRIHALLSGVVGPQYSMNEMTRILGELALITAAKD